MADMSLYNHMVGMKAKSDLEDRLTILNQTMSRDTNFRMTNKLWLVEIDYYPVSLLCCFPAPIPFFCASLRKRFALVDESGEFYPRLTDFKNDCSAIPKSCFARHGEKECMRVLRNGSYTESNFENYPEFRITDFPITANTTECVAYVRINSVTSYKHL